MKDIKIRLLSYQNAHNYGAVLQAYGLQNAIKSLGYSDVKFIKYNPKYLSGRYVTYKTEGSGLKKFASILRNVLRTCRRPFMYLSKEMRNRAFDRSIDRMLEQTDRLILSEYDLKGENCDVLICGSDQIWNTAITGSFDRVFFGYGEYVRTPHKIAYAPSTETSSLTDERLKEIAPLLDNFDSLSVRENTLSEILQPFIEKRIEVCVDPTILCGREAYDRVAIKPKQRKYIVVYAYNPGEKLIRDLIASIPNREEYSVIVLTLVHTASVFEYLNPNIKAEISVEEFLGYFKYADYVVTNSFHGLAFSLLFEKNFNAAFVQNKSARLISLMTQLDLMDRYNYDMSRVTWDNIEYKAIAVKVNQIRNRSLDYIKTCIENA